MFSNSRISGRHKWGSCQLIGRLRRHSQLAYKLIKLILKNNYLLKESKIPKIRDISTRYIFPFRQFFLKIREWKYR